MNYLADLHIHSRFSIATSKNLDLAHLHQAAQLKGITVVGSGDCTHPGWLAELKDQLEPAEEGLFKFRPELSKDIDAAVPQVCRRSVRFMLQGEISCIYKKEGRTRKNHNLVFFPDLESVQRFQHKLEKIGNISSDGRPILGLDARNLLEIVLETHPDAFLIPAHIWTPWFSMLGSKSGFDSLEACFDDLSAHIFAVETGLSSDPAMNWRVSSLDGLRLVSNSDAHSPQKLAREANRFETDLSYSAIKAALEDGKSNSFLGTVEFYPEEGKYHLDGHRKCGVRWEPRRTLEADGICPVCEKPLTLGVLHRVEALADRVSGFRPRDRRPFDRIVPLKDILSEIFRVGAQSKKIQGYFDKALERLGSEMDILLNLSPEEIDRAGIDLLGEAVARMRQNKVAIAPGYDGEFGKIKIFSARERRKLTGQRTLFKGRKSGDGIQPPSVQRELNFIGQSSNNDAAPPSAPNVTPGSDAMSGGSLKALLSRPKRPLPKVELKLNKYQQAAVDHEGGPLLIVAGPGTGKTHTLTQRMATLIIKRQVPAAQMLAVTFTNKAAGEMRERLVRLLGAQAPLPWIGTFHALGRHLLQDPELNLGHGAWANWNLADESLQQQLVAEAHRQVRREGKPSLPSVAKAAQGVVAAKQQLTKADQCPVIFSEEARQQGFVQLYGRYEELLTWQRLLDFEDLVANVIQALESDPDALARLRSRFGYLFIDEYQDINYGQYRLVRKLTHAKADICVIGDPDQSIYGFRGSDRAYFERFDRDFPGARLVQLNRNYRSTPTILSAAVQILPAPETEETLNENRAEPVIGSVNLKSDVPGAATIGILESGSPRAEAVAVGKTIESLMGGMDLHAIDQKRVPSHSHEGYAGEELSFADFAVLFRTVEQSRVFCDVFDAAGIPWRLAGRKQILDNPALVCLIALLKMIENQGGIWDLINSAPLLTPRLSTSTLDILKTWSFERRFDFDETLKNAQRFPIPALGNRRQRELHLWIESLKGMQRELSRKPLVKKLEHLCVHLGLQPEIENNDAARQGYKHLKQWAAEAENSGSRFITRLALNQDPDLLSRPAEKVSLLTMHAAKGLEFPVVFLAGCEDGWIPLRRDNPEEWDEGEERRLLYVAMTRARYRLYLSWARQRTLYGQKLKRKISPLLGGVDPGILLREALERQRPRKHRQLQLF